MDYPFFIFLVFFAGVFTTSLTHTHKYTNSYTCDKMCVFYFYIISIYFFLHILPVVSCMDLCGAIFLYFGVISIVNVGDGMLRER